MILSMAPGRDHDDFYHTAEFSELPDPLCKKERWMKFNKSFIIVCQTLNGKQMLTNTKNMQNMAQIKWTIRAWKYGMTNVRN
jgi:hypothetical protein